MAKTSYNNVMNQILEKVMRYAGHVYFITLTCRDDNGINKDTISNFINKLEYRDIQVDGYVWVKELQRRGVVHYHMLILTPRMMKNFYDVVSASWKHGFVFVEGVREGEVRNTMLYLNKYMKKELGKTCDNEKMKRKMGRGGILRFQVEPFLGRVARFSGFQYVGSAGTKGMRVRIYRSGDLVMFVSSSVNGASIDVFNWNIDKIVEKFKYAYNKGLARIMNSPEYLALSKEEREDVIGYHLFSKELDKLLWKLGVSRGVKTINL